MSDAQETSPPPGRTGSDAAHGLAEANRVLVAWAETVGRRDVGAVLALYAPDAILVPTLSDEVRGSEEERRRYFETFLANEGLTCSLTDQKARVGPGPGTVAIGGRYTFRMGPEGREETVRARYLFTFEEIDGRWRITGHHSSKAAEAVETA